MVIVAVVLLAVVGGGVFVMKDKIWPPPVADAYVEVNAIPYGSVKQAKQLDGKFTQTFDKDNQTPIRLNLPSGEYEITVVGPSGQEKTDHVKISKTASGSMIINAR
jgi:uncharacterized protein YgfB (UPF0149 family)